MADYPTFLKNIEKKNGYRIKVKGGSVGKPNAFNKSLIIIKKAIVNHFVEGKSIYDTINENQELIDYQIIKKRTAQTRYMDMTHKIMLEDKVIRVFPVTKEGIQILDHKGSKVPDVPEECVIIKDNIMGKSIRDIPNFDINYYVNKFNDELDSWLNGAGDSEEGADE